LDLERQGGKGRLAKRRARLCGEPVCSKCGDAVSPDTYWIDDSGITCERCAVQVHIRHMWDAISVKSQPRPNLARKVGEGTPRK